MISLKLIGKIMGKYLIVFLYLLLFLTTVGSYAAVKTNRIPQFSNKEVSVWKTVIYPNKDQALTMHRHEHNRVLVAFDNGLLKIVNNKGKIHYLKLKKNKAYYLTKDIPNELHTDENMSEHPIRVLVIELKK